MNLFNRLNLVVVLLLSVAIGGSVPGSVYAYLENYPPHGFKDPPPRHLQLEPLVDFDHRDYTSKDGKVVARLSETSDNLDFSLTVNGTTLVQMKERATPMPYAVYQADLNGDGLSDYIALYNYRGNGLAAMNDQVDIFLTKKDGTFQKITFESMSAGLEDFADLDGDGKHEIIVTGFYGGAKHNYFTYDVYQIEGYGLVNANAKFKKFNKVIWFSNRPNDKDTTHLTAKERAEITATKDRSVKLAVIGSTL